MSSKEETKRTTLKEEMIFRVDFNAVDRRNNRLSALLRYAMGSGRPEIGDWVWLMDGDGNGCLGRVVEVNGVLIKAEPNWSTWNPPFRVEKAGWFVPDADEEESSARSGGYDRAYIQV